MVRVIVSTLSSLDDNRWSYLVEVTESDGSGSQTRHKVSMDREYYEKISSGIIGPEDFVKKSFKFLLKVDTEGIQHQTDKRVFFRV